MKILILCTGNSCRSQMAEGFLKKFNSDMYVVSAGTEPSSDVNSTAIKVMAEKGIDISGEKPKNVSKFINDSFDYVITVCDDANETCPVFLGEVKHRLHIGFEDPAKFVGSEDEVLTGFRRIRDEIEEEFVKLYKSEISPRLNRNS